MTRAFAPLIGACLLAASAPPATPPGADADQASVFSTRIEAVRVDVLVTANGRPVPGLGPDDFEVRDNGVRQTVTLLGLDEAPLRVLLTVDLSASVEGPRLADLRAAGHALVGGLRPDDEAGLIGFNHAVSRLQAPTPAFDRVRAALDAIRPAGATSLIDATFASLAGVPADLRRTLVVVFSDGLDTSSWLTEDQVVDAARRSQAIVYAVAVAQRRTGPRFLRAVTDATGGRLLEIERTDDLDVAFAGVLDEFRQRYLLSYTPAGVDTPGWHTLDVRVRRRGVEVRARPGYVR